MSTVRYESTIGSLVITSDAYVLGEVEGIRYDPLKWQGDYLLVAVKKGLEAHMGTGKSVFSSSKILIPMNLIQTINDVIILAHSLLDLKEFVKPDNINIPNLGQIIGKKVVTSENQNLGTVSDINMDVLDIWPVISISIRPDKEMIKILGLKKPMFSKTPAISLEICAVSSVLDMLNLNLDMTGVKENMTVGD